MEGAGRELQGRDRHGDAPRHKAEEGRGEQRQQGERRQAVPAQAGKMFDPDCYRRRGVCVWGIFGAGEAAGRWLRCRYRESTRERSGTALAIARDAGALNRIRCTVENGRMPTMA